MPYIRNKRTGEVVEVDAGGLPVGQRPPMNPTFPYQAPKIQAEIGNTQAGTGKTIVDTRKTQQEIEQEAAKFGREVRQYPVSKEDAAIIDRLRQDSSNAGANLDTINEAQRVVDRFKTGPNRAGMLRYAIPEEDDWLPTRLAKGAVSMFTDDQDEKDYAYLRALQSGRVLDAQIAQKGPQTEADARRLQLSEVSPDKPQETNALILGRTNLKELLRQEQPSFYGDWARKYGSLNAPDERGRGVDAAWAERSNRAYQNYNADPRVKRLQGGTRALKNAPRKASNGWSRVTVVGN